MLIDPVSANTDPALALIRDVYPADLLVSVSHARPRRPGEKPFVTLTYAQSLDGKIAGKGGKQLMLSGTESMTLTHRLRQLHDSILVGVGTVINDDPQLTGPGIDLRNFLLDEVATPYFGRSLMVEGGASVISSFLSTPGLVDLVIVTVAPVLIGDDGVSVTKEGVHLPRLTHVRTQVFGKDTVFVCKPVYP
ncbi:hypothetical protein Rt10032_c01g0594 [Rhodotorula toruloides]|uniref:2,5-diamino-6-ribosylamino-4(3H)-pyrimidinone 5'-phosphate reductase n=1 Tax=Rhodotorula toruloides TaxID=5286 RepID=A0A511K8D0_RHOTO|nr:hypothetical protein Rt10032_c01g0594 [Rhodotorula toruloides]